MDKTCSVPTGLQHQSIIGVDNYSSYDGPYKDETDAKALSIGIAQWENEKADDFKEISAKVFRHTGKRWSPQSEELPLHRCFDLCVLAVQALQYSTKKEFFDKKGFEPYVVDENKLGTINLYFKKYKSEFLLEKMNNLKDLLDRFLSQYKDEQELNT